MSRAILELIMANIDRLIPEDAADEFTDGYQRGLEHAHLIIQAAAGSEQATSRQPWQPTPAQRERYGTDADFEAYRDWMAIILGVGHTQSPSAYLAARAVVAVMSQTLTPNDLFFLKICADALEAREAVGLPDKLRGIIERLEKGGNVKPVPRKLEWVHAAYNDELDHLPQEYWYATAPDGGYYSIHHVGGDQMERRPDGSLFQWSCDSSEATIGGYCETYEEALEAANLNWQVAALRGYTNYFEDVL